MVHIGLCPLSPHVLYSCENYEKTWAIPNDNRSAQWAFEKMSPFLNFQLTMQIKKIIFLALILTFPFSANDSRQCYSIQYVPKIMFLRSSIPFPGMRDCAKF